MSRKRSKQMVVVPSPPGDAPAEQLHFASALGKLVIFAVVAVGLVTIASWVELRLRPPPGWVCWDVTRTTADGHRHGGHCEPAPGWHVERWENVDVAVPDRTVVVRRHFVARD